MPPLTVCAPLRPSATSIVAHGLDGDLGTDGVCVHRRRRGRTFMLPVIRPLHHASVHTPLRKAHHAVDSPPLVQPAGG